MNAKNEIGDLIYIKNRVVPDLLPTIYGYIRTLEPRKIVVIGNNRRKVVKKVLNERYLRARKSVLGRNLKFSKLQASVYIVDVLAAQSRTCKEVYELFKSDKVVICSIRFPTDIRPELRGLVDEVIVSQDDPSTNFISKLDLCYRSYQMEQKPC